MLPSWVEPLAQPPARRRDHVGTGDDPVTVGIVDFPWPLVDRRLFKSANVIRPSSIDVGQIRLHCSRDLRLVDPDVVDEIRIVVVDAGVDTATVTAYEPVVVFQAVGALIPHVPVRPDWAL